MNEFLKVLFSLSFSGTLLILILLSCKFLYKSRLSKQWQYYIWLIVIVRLLFPFALETNLVGSLFHKIDNNLIQTNINIQDKQSDFLEDTKYTKSNIILNKNNIKNSKWIIQKIFYIAVENAYIIWLIVAVALFIRKITIYQSFIKYVKAGQTQISDLKLWEQLGKLVEKSGIKTSVGLYTNGLISSPILIGFFRPCIIIPLVKLSDINFQYIFLYELTHYKRRDMFYKWLVQFTICVHWFNPFIYLMEREINKACELSCDEVIIRKLNIKEKRVYGDTLLNAMGTGRYKNSLVSMALNEGKQLLKERLDAIMKFKKKTWLCGAISISLALILCFGATVIGAYTLDSKKAGESKIKYTSNVGEKTFNVMEETKADVKIQKETDNGNIISKIQKEWTDKELLDEFNSGFEELIDPVLDENLPVYGDDEYLGTYKEVLQSEGKYEMWLEFVRRFYPERLSK